MNGNVRGWLRNFVTQNTNEEKLSKTILLTQLQKNYSAFFLGAAFFFDFAGRLLPKEPIAIFPFFVFLSPLPIFQN